MPSITSIEQEDLPEHASPIREENPPAKKEETAKESKKQE